VVGDHDVLVATVRERPFLQALIAGRVVETGVGRAAPVSGVQL
jgi:hypothetical protein